jgi:hypothetical protein
MSPHEFRAAITALDLNMSNGARFLHIDRRTAGSYASGRLKVPALVAMLLSVMTHSKISPERVSEISGVPFRRKNGSAA